MKFHYTAAKNDGKTVEGAIEAKDTAEVLAILSAKGLKPITLKKEKSFISSRRKVGIFSSITLYDKIFLTKYMALMLKTGSDLFKAIDILISDFSKQSMKSFLYEVRENLEKGQPFHLAFSKYPKFFSLVFVNLIKAGETSGNLEKTFEGLSESLLREQELKQQIRSALIYPILLIIGATTVIFFIISFSLPKIAGLFQESGFNPPTFSKIVFAVGLFLNKYFFFIIGLIIALLLAFWILMSQSASFKRLFQYAVRKLPFIGKLLKIIAIQRFASTFASLISSGMPLLDSMEITAQVIGDENFKNALVRIARDGIARGLTIGEAFKKEAVFPNTISSLISISEKSGNLSGILFTIADFYESEIKSSIKILVSFLEPALLLFIGISIAIIALAVIVPVYQLIGSF